jgi:hypothetical protein
LVAASPPSGSRISETDRRNSSSRPSLQFVAHSGTVNPTLRVWVDAEPAPRRAVVPMGVEDCIR